MSFISQLHRSLRMSRITREDASSAQRLTDPLHKSYPRFESVALPSFTPIEVPLSKALDARHSFNMSTSDRTLTREEWSHLLGTALRVRPDTRESRPYPSGGALYPIETYAIGTVLDAHSREVYHYDPVHHALERLWAIPKTTPMKHLFRGSVTPLSEVALVFTATWQRSEKKYGRFAYELALLEAGHMAQNILLSAAALGIAARPVAGFDDTMMESILDIDTDCEQAVYAIMLCAAGTTDSPLAE